MKNAPILLFTVLLAACVSVRDKAVHINPGQSTEEVLSIMGPPQDRQFSMSQEAWQYCNTGAINDHYVIVWFDNGLVTGMNTYNNDETGLCTSFFKLIDWEDAPDQTIEIRSR